MDDRPLFTVDGDRFVPTPWARGPWDKGLLHGGATAALLAHGAELARGDPALVATRLTVDLLRPVRDVPLRISSQIVRDGKRIRLIDVLLHDTDHLVARASALMLRRQQTGLTVDAGDDGLLPGWNGLRAYEFGVTAGTQAFHCGTEFLEVPRDDLCPDFALWIRVPFTLLPNRPLTPFERAAATSDFVNGVGSFAKGKYGFINADITLSLHREPQEEWLCMQSHGRPDFAGIAASVVTLHDEAGLLGSVSCSCLANPVSTRFGADIRVGE